MSTTSEPLTDGARPIAAWRGIAYSATMVALSTLGTGYFIGLFNPYATAAFGVTQGALSFIFSLSTIAAVIPMFFLGRLFDRIGLRTYTLGLLAAFAAAAALVAWSPNLAFYALGVFFIRLVGDWLFTHAGLTAATRFFGPERMRLSGLVALGYAIGPSIFPSLAIAIAAAHGWKMAWLAIAVAMLVVFMPLFAWLLGSSAQPRPTPQALSKPKGEAILVLDRRILPYLPALMTAALLLSGLLFHQSVWVAARNVPVEWLSLGLAVFAISQTSAMLVSGLLGERWPLPRLVAMHALPAALGLVLVLLFQGPWTILAYLAGAGVTTGFYFSLTPLLLGKVYGYHRLGAARAALQSVTLVCSALSTTGLGLWMDAGFSMDLVLLGAVVCVGLSSALAWFRAG